MVNYSTQLVDYYYFINFINTSSETTTGVVYKISLKNDSDECGQRLVIRNGETQEIDLAGNSSRFPNVKVEYSYTKDDKEVTDTKYYWFQSLIKDGDTYTNGVFTPNTSHDTDGDGTPDTTYMAIVIDSIKKDIKNYVNNGYNLDRIKERIPYWCYCKKDDTVKIDNKTVTIKSINDEEGVLSEDFTDEAITNQIKDALKEKLLVIDNNYLDNFGLEVDASTFAFIEKSE